MRSRAVLMALASLVLACVSTLPPTPADRDAAITREDFSDWLSSYALETRREVLGKQSKHGIVILDYGYLADDGELAVGLTSTVYWTRTQAEARNAYGLLVEGGRRDRDGIQLRPAFVHLGWAEDAKAYQLMRNREVVGNLLFAHRENVAVMVRLSGLYANDPRLFERKLEPLLWQLSRHTPVSTP